MAKLQKREKKALTQDTSLLRITLFIPCPAHGLYFVIKQSISFKFDVKIKKERTTRYSTPWWWHRYLFFLCSEQVDCKSFVEMFETIDITGQHELLQFEVGFAKYHQNTRF